MTLIERYNNKYKQQVIDLILNIQQNEFGVPVTLNDQPDLQDVESFYIKDDGYFWIAIDDDKVVGTIAMIDFHKGRTALRKMFVHADYRGKDKGLGQKLLDTLIAWCREKNISEIYLGTFDKLVAAQRFYIKNGFVEIPKETLPDDFPLMAVDNRFFKLIIDKEKSFDNIIVRPATENDLPQILDIYNEAVANTTASYDYEPHTLAMRKEWYDDKIKKGFPVFVAEQNNEILGYSNLGSFRDKEGYKYTAENSVYVKAGCRGKGIGKLLLAPLITSAKQMGLHVIVAGIDADNTTSIHLHKQFGFVEVSHFKEVGYKFNRWLDLVFMQLVVTPIP